MILPNKRVREDSTTYNLRTAEAVLEACVWDLEAEEARMRTIDGKLTQLAAFSGVSISISGAIGGSVLAAQHLPAAFLIALGACLGLAALWLLAGVILAFRALAPKLYEGTDEREVIARTTPNTLRSNAASVIATFAGTRRDVLIAARKINDQKAKATTTAVICVVVGASFLVAGLLVTAVGSVV